MIDRSLSLDVIVDPGVSGIPVDALKALATFASGIEPALPDGSWTVTLRVTDDERIAAIHDRFFGDPSPTDVISFPSGDDLGAREGYLGDIVVSATTAAVNAADQEHSAHREIAFLLLHGLLHLCGYDDATDDERATMLARQSVILASFERASELEW